MTSSPFSQPSSPFSPPPSLFSPHSNSSGLHYFLFGWKLMWLPVLRRFVLLPLLANILLMASGLWWLVSHIQQWIDSLLSYVPGWLQWISTILWLLAILSVLLLYGYFFTTVANWIAAPFNGLLAEQLEARLTGKAPPDSGIISLCRDIPRILLREAQKFLYTVPRFLLLLVISLIPGIGQLLGPFLLFLFGAWMMSIQYCDYPFDNHKVPFATMRQTLKQQSGMQLQFGCMVSLFAMIPLLNMLVMPAAVCGATAMWVDKYAHRFPSLD
ncbi:MAG: sulfate transporter CysZ [Enterobacteriaceae bacterium]